MPNEVQSNEMTIIVCGKNVRTHVSIITSFSLFLLMQTTVEYACFSQPTLEAMRKIPVPVAADQKTELEYNQTMTTVLAKSCQSDRFRYDAIRDNIARIKGVRQEYFEAYNNLRVSTGNMRHSCKAIYWNQGSRPYLLSALLDAHEALRRNMVLIKQQYSRERALSRTGLTEEVKGRAILKDLQDRVCIKGTKLCPERRVKIVDRCDACVLTIEDLHSRLHRYRGPLESALVFEELDTLCDDLRFRHTDDKTLLAACDDLIADYDDELVAHTVKYYRVNQAERNLAFCSSAGFCKKKKGKSKKSMSSKKKSNREL
mmetsp:Transcript_60748/g.83399  ORF Transcript_60748/g.83399 Transcript_60748/m.83399 type:complete len:315 (-) Transcript_60748:158-1102(-)